VKGHFAAKGGPLGLGKLPQGLFRRLMFLVERIPQSPHVARLNPQATAELFQGSVIVDAIHVL